MYMFYIHVSGSAQRCTKATLQKYGLLSILFCLWTFVKTLKMNVAHFSEVPFHDAVVFQ